MDELIRQTFITIAVGGESGDASPHDGATLFSRVGAVKRNLSACRHRESTPGARKRSMTVLSMARPGAQTGRLDRLHVYRVASDRVPNAPPGGDGVFVTGSDNRAARNSATRNGGAGLEIQGASAVVEANLTTSNGEAGWRSTAPATR